MLEGGRFGPYLRDPAIFVSARCMITNVFKQAAPGNVSTRVRFVGP